MRNLHYFVTEIYRVKNNISPEIMSDIFHFQKIENYNLRNGTHLASKNMKTTLFRKEAVSNLRAKIWPLLPEEFKNASSLQVFKNALKEWKPTSCPCWLCKTYIQHVGGSGTCFVWEFFLESNKEIKKNNMLDNTVRTNKLILELIPPKKV